MTFVYAKQGTSEDLQCMSQAVPSGHGGGWVLMSSPKPINGDHVAEPDGTWKDVTDYAAKEKEEIASDRYKMETSGVLHDGKTFKTDERSTLRLIGLCFAIYAGWKTEEDWKCVEGWYNINQGNYMFVAGAVLGHISNAFKWEKNEEEKL